MARMGAQGPDGLFGRTSSVLELRSAAYSRDRRPESRRGWRKEERIQWMRDDSAPGPMTQASAPQAPGRLAREDARNFGSRTLAFAETEKQPGDVPGGLPDVLQPHALIGTVGEVAGAVADARRHYRHSAAREEKHWSGAARQGH